MRTCAKKGHGGILVVDGDGGGGDDSVKLEVGCLEMLETSGQDTREEVCGSHLGDVGWASHSEYSGKYRSAASCHFWRQRACRIVQTRMAASRRNTRWKRAPGSKNTGVEEANAVLLFSPTVTWSLSISTSAAPLHTPPPLRDPSPPNYPTPQRWPTPTILPLSPSRSTSSACPSTSRSL